MMLQRASILCALILGVAIQVDSFSLLKPSPIVSSRSSICSTCLWAEEENETETAAEETAAGDASASATDILSSPAFLKRKLDVLKSDIAKCEEEIEATKVLLDEGKAEWGPQLDELQKEYKTIQERMSTQSKQGDTMSTIQVVREMLELLDNFDRAFGAVKPETDAEIAIEAEYKEVYQSILATFEKLGVTEVDTVGKEFDYEVHQAVMQRPSEDYEEGIVCDEYQKGFLLNDQLIRAAMVAVAA